ncbi:MAG: hypothetical protein ACK4UN_06905, partial [Limisphaerales bacterium]
HWALDDVRIIGSPLRLHLLGMLEPDLLSLVLVAGNARTVILESSEDLEQWTIVMSYYLPWGIGDVQEPISSGARFYRLQLADW